ncbi:hypothetical protein BCR34DRAFT_629460 [Clohesyomyces aquaticus]|uniref:Protein kinase domain-containing protein n=1 Tax=Clohesyomyces aquaticus TaxID=1231657 RepID=A0A1Y1Y486_9PLEO|nr:hypothetical protein BCR34DRAFT_629460 [Clohesyomyces aquaticus]
MSSLFRIGQVLKVRIGQYTVTKDIQVTIWFAKNLSLETVVMKSVEGHPRVETGRDVLKRFQYGTPYLRHMIDEIEELDVPVTIALQYIDDNLWAWSAKRTLNRKELKYVSRRILEALSVLYEEGFVRTDIKRHNVLVNFRPVSGSDSDSNPFCDVQLAYLGVVNRQYRYFGPFPPKKTEIATTESLHTIWWLSKEIPREKLTQFAWTTEREVVKKDKDFVGKIMKMDWRNRPTAKETLEDEWWNDEE